MRARHQRHTHPDAAGVLIGLGCEVAGSWALIINLPLKVYWLHFRGGIVGAAPVPLASEHLA